MWHWRWAMATENVAVISGKYYILKYIKLVKTVLLNSNNIGFTIFFYQMIAALVSIFSKDKKIIISNFCIYLSIYLQSIPMWSIVIYDVSLQIIFVYIQAALWD